MEDAKDLVPGVDYPRTFQEIDEFAFRFNRRQATARDLLFHRLAQQAVTGWTAMYDNIVGNTEFTRPPIALE